MDWSGSNKYRGTTKSIHVLAELVRAAQYQGVTTYQDIAVIMGLPLTGNHMSKETGTVLGEIATDEVNAGRPIITAVVVRVDGKPGPGFYTVAHQLKRIASPEEDVDFWDRELKAVYKAWKGCSAPAG